MLPNSSGAIFVSNCTSEFRSVDGSTCRESQISHMSCSVLPAGVRLLMITAVMRRWGEGRGNGCRGERVWRV